MGDCFCWEFSGVLGGLWPWVNGPSSPYMSPMGARVPVLSPMMTQPHGTARKEVLETVKFWKICKCHWAA